MHVKKNNIHIRVSYRMLDQILPIVRKSGFGIELFISSHYLDRPLENLNSVQQYLNDEKGFSLHAPFMDLSPGGFDETIRDITIKRIVQAVNAVNHLSPERIVVHPGYDTFKFYGMLDSWLQNSVNTWTKILAACPSSQFAVENVFEKNPDSLIELVRQIGSERFGCCFDTGHFNVFSEIPLNTWLDKIKPYLVELHLHDNKGKEDQHLGMGKGIFDFDCLFRAISSMTKKPVFTLEAHTKDGIQESISFLKNRITSD